MSEDLRLMMFRHSAVALAYFDEDGDRLQRRKDLNWSYLWPLANRCYSVGMRQQGM